MGLNIADLSNIDLNTVIMHLDNFVDTWQGWGKVIKGVVGVLDVPGKVIDAIVAVA